MRIYNGDLLGFLDTLCCREENREERGKGKKWVTWGMQEMDGFAGVFWPCEILACNFFFLIFWLKMEICKKWDFRLEIGFVIGI